jgi:hypothetical protein
MSGEMILEDHGGEMWDELKDWLSEQVGRPITAINVKQKINEIEREYGIDYI